MFKEVHLTISFSFFEAIFKAVFKDAALSVVKEGPLILLIYYIHLFDSETGNQLGQIGIKGLAQSVLGEELSVCSSLF